MRVSVTMEDHCRSTHQHQVSITSKPCSIATYLQKITRCVCVSCVCVRGETDVGAEGSEDKKKKKALFAYYSCKFCDSLWELGHMNAAPMWGRREENRMCAFSCAIIPVAALIILVGITLMGGISLSGGANICHHKRAPPPHHMVGREEKLWSERRGNHGKAKMKKWKKKADREEERV